MNSLLLRRYSRKMNPLWLLILVFGVMEPDCLYAADYKIGERLPKNTPTAETKINKDKKTAYQVVEWEALLPKGWDLVKEFNTLDFDKFEDDDPRAMQALEKMRKKWDSAPIEPSMNGKRIRISGFMVPLEQNEGKVSEFLLAPYFGACVHVPPPPANQLIHVTLAKPVEIDDPMADVWVNGTLHTEKIGTDMGQSGYRLQADEVTPYTAPKKAQMFLNIGGMSQRLTRSRQ